MRFITLTTDFGNSDYYVGAFKGNLYNHITELTIVDISNEIAHFNVNDAAFVVRNAFKNFPANTLHIVRVGEFTRRGLRYLATSFESHYFLLPDNGIISLILPNVNNNIVVMDIADDNVSLNDRLTKAAAHIINTGNFEDLGSKANQIQEKMYLQPVIKEGLVRGTVIYVDDYGNLITNIHKGVFQEQVNGSNYEVLCRGDRFTAIGQKYNDVVPGEKVCFFNNQDLLEIAINEGSAERLLGVSINDVVQIEFQ